LKDNVLLFVACQLVNKVGPCSRSCLWHGVLTFHTATSCHSWRLENTEHSCWWWSGC